METLKYRAQFYALNDFGSDPDFESLLNTKNWEELLELIEMRNQEKLSGGLAFSFEMEGFHPEGITYDPGTERFYISDIRDGLIYSFNKSGEEGRPEFDLKEHGFWSAMGLPSGITNYG